MKRKVKKKEEADIKKSLTTKYGSPFTATFTYVDEIKKGPSGKYHDFISEVKT